MKPLPSPFLIENFAPGAKGAGGGRMGGRRTSPDARVERQEKTEGSESEEDSKKAIAAVPKEQVAKAKNKREQMGETGTRS